MASNILRRILCRWLHDTLHPDSCSMGAIDQGTLDELANSGGLPYGAVVLYN
jgi:hypothetical protein